MINMFPNMFYSGSLIDKFVGIPETHGNLFMYQELNNSKYTCIKKDY